MDKKKDDNLPFAIGAGGLALVAVVSQKQNEIKHWLYSNMMLLTLAGFALLAMLVLLSIRRMKKKEEEILKRMRAAKSVKPTHAESDYYRRRR